MVSAEAQALEDKAIRDLELLGDPGEDLEEKAMRAAEMQGLLGVSRPRYFDCFHQKAKGFKDFGLKANTFKGLKRTFA